MTFVAENDTKTNCGAAIYVLLMKAKPKYSLHSQHLLASSKYPISDLPGCHHIEITVYQVIVSI